MDRQDIKELIFTVTQSLISLITLIGGGIFIIKNPESSAIPIVAPFITSVIAFYLYQATANQTTANNARATAAAAPQAVKE